MHNPFDEKITVAGSDADAISRSLNGDSAALEALILRHQSWIFNIALTMTGDIHLAEDVTQEVLIKIITKLSTYDPQKAAFRTWLYRIVVNHIVNMKENKKEKFFAKMMENNDNEMFINNQPDRRKAIRVENERLKEETRTSCILCVLLCLTRKERIIFTLAAIFDVTDKVGAEICEISRVNFRQSLYRCRKKVYRFFMDNCSLLNENNPCTCADQTNFLLKTGIIVPEQLIVEKNSWGTIQSILGGTVRHVEDSYHEFLSLFRRQPFLKGPDMVSWLRDLMKSDHYRSLMDCASL